MADLLLSDGTSFLLNVDAVLSLTGDLLLANGIDDLRLADGVSELLLSGGAAASSGTNTCFILKADGIAKLLEANGSDHLLLFNCVVSGGGTVAVVSAAFLNVPTVRRPFLGRTHISQSRGTDDFHGLSRRGGGLTGFLRRPRT